MCGECSYLVHQERAVGPQTLEVEVEVEHVGALNSAARSGADPQLLAKIRPAVPEAAAHVLSGPHTAQHHLDAVGAKAGLEALLEPRSTTPFARTTIAF